MRVRAIQLAMWCAATQAYGATPADDGGDSAVSVLIGTDSAFDGDPATLRIRLQGEADIVDGGVVGLAGVLPITWLTAGTDSFGFSTRQSVFEVPPSLRLRLLNNLWVRPYADLGVGMVITTESRDGFLMKSRDNNVGWMTRSAIGVELGATHGVMVQIEPLSAQTYHLGGDFARFSAMIGVGSRF
jgi:hypothetical protein